MKSILVGIDGSARGTKALMWAARQANREEARLCLLTVVDPRFVREAGATDEMVHQAVEDVLSTAVKRVAQTYPSVRCETEVANGKVVDTLVDRADEHDIVVLGTHHGRSIGKSVGGATGLRVAISSKVPTVVVPADWEPSQDGQGIAVAVGPDEDDLAAITFAVEHALRLGVPLRLVSAWGLPAYLTKPAEVMGGGLQPVGVAFQNRLDAIVAQLKEQHPDLQVTGQAVEGPSPTKVLLEYSKECEALVMGTHSRTALGRTLFGSVTHSVLLNLTAPTAIVPLEK